MRAEFFSGEKMAKGLLAAIAILLLASSCGKQPAWWETGGFYGRETFAVELPKGWMLSGTTPFMLITRDGLLLQGILIGRDHVDADLANTRKKFRENMLAHEAAEIFLDDRSSNTNITNFSVIENRPANVAGLPGFRILYSYRGKDHLTYKSVCYGLIREKTFYQLAYYAPARHYFDRDIGVFEAIVKSFRFTTKEREVSIPGRPGQDEPATF